jgi:hypothetical protein
MTIFHEELIISAYELQLALMTSYISLMLPINLFHRYFFFKKTNRNATGATINDQLEYVMFFTTAMTLYKWFDLQTIDPSNKYHDLDEQFEKSEIFMLNIMW